MSMKKVLEIMISLLVGVACVLWLNTLYSNEITLFSKEVPKYMLFIVGAIFALIFYIFFSSKASAIIIHLMTITEERMIRMTGKELLLSVLGALLGLAIANLIGLAINGYGLLSTVVIFLLNVVFGYTGFRVARIKKDELFFSQIRSAERGADVPERLKDCSGKPKFLDTSVIIDGRILDIIKTGFVEGKIIVPSFVLDELRHIADSSDGLKRNRGRRGLDILNEMQKQINIPVEIQEGTVKDDAEVDMMLLKMAKAQNGFVLTNDFNLNKVAEFQGVSVLNINELANAVKPVALPGEEMKICISKEGKESGQGIGYLNDGTMLVIEGGNHYIGQTMDVIVTSVLQTAAGRMIFAKVKGEKD